MATIKPDWTENVNVHSSASLSSGSSATDDIDLDTLGADKVFLTIEIIFGSTPDGNVLVEVFGSADSGTNDDTEPLFSYTVEEGVSATKRKSIEIPSLPYIAITVTNNDTTDSVTYEAWQAWRNWNSA